MLVKNETASRNGVVLSKLENVLMMVYEGVQFSLPARLCCLVFLQFGIKLLICITHNLYRDKYFSPINMHLTYATYLIFY